MTYNNNLGKRRKRIKNIYGNSRDFWSIRLLSNFKKIKSVNIIRTDNMDLAINPTYYFETKKITVSFPQILQLNVCYN